MISMRSWSASAPAARSPASADSFRASAARNRNDPGRSDRLDSLRMGEDRNWCKAGSWAVEGIGEDFIPDIADMSFVTDAFEIDDAESFATARELLRKEGILGGSSTGTLLAGALRYCRAANENETRRHFRLRHAGTNISRRCTTISGWPSRDSCSARRRAT